MSKNLSTKDPIIFNRVISNIMLQYDTDNIIDYKSKYGKLEDIPVNVTELNY